MQPIDYAELLRKNVKARVDSNRGVQAGLARAMGVEDPAVSKWLKGEHNPAMDKLGAIAAFFKCSLADLFNPAKESAGSDLPVQPTGPSSTSNAPSGDAHGTDLGLLRSHVAELEAENTALRTAIATLTDQYKALVAIGVKARTPQKRKPALRKRRG